MKHFAHIVQNLAANGVVFQQLYADVTPALALWRPAPQKWNLLEIACHLRDEETDDFRRRVQQTLDNPQVAPPAIDPEGWVLARGYANAVLADVLQAFGAARAQSVDWLEHLVDPQWENTWQHPSMGPLSAGLFLNNWLAHDYLHIRQIVALKFAYLQQVSGEDLQYAGTW
jgi:hypothetical protein